MTEKKLSFNLKNEGAGITGTVDVQSPMESHGQIIILGDKTFLWGMGILVISMGILFALGLISACLFNNKGSTEYIIPILLVCVSILAVSALFFWIYCWYRVCMARSIVDEQKMSYGVLKELVGKLPERNETNMLIKESRDTLKAISGKLVELDQTRGLLANSCGFLQQIVQILPTMKK